MRLILVACAAQKRNVASAAKDLYTSDLFAKSRAWAEREVRTGRADAWYILSACHGLVHPDTVLEPYDHTLNIMSRSERQAWAMLVTQGLREIKATELTLLAGERYREFVVATAKRLNWKVSVPLLGMGIGQQKAWLKAQLSRLVPKEELIHDPSL